MGPTYAYSTGPRGVGERFVPGNEGRVGQEVVRYPGGPDDVKILVSPAIAVYDVESVQPVITL